MPAQSGDFAPQMEPFPFIVGFLVPFDQFGKWIPELLIDKILKSGLDILPSFRLANAGFSGQAFGIWIADNSSWILLTNCLSSVSVYTCFPTYFAPNR